MKKLVLGVLTMSVLVLAVSVLSEPGIERRPETAAVRGDRVVADPVSYLPHLGSGQGLSSDIVLTNPSTSELLTGFVEFRDDDGLEQELEIVGLGPRSSVDFAIQPLGAVTIQTDSSGELATGSAVIHANLLPGAVVRFGIPEIGIAGVGTSVPAQALVVPVRKRSDGLNSGIAFSNPFEWPVYFNLILSDSEGRKVATGDSIELPAGGHLARFFNELFPTVTAPVFEGTAAGEVDTREKLPRQPSNWGRWRASSRHCRSSRDGTEGGNSRICRNTSLSVLLPLLKSLHPFTMRAPGVSAF